MSFTNAIFSLASTIIGSSISCFIAIKKSKNEIEKTKIKAESEINKIREESRKEIEKIHTEAEEQINLMKSQSEIRNQSDQNEMINNFASSFMSDFLNNPKEGLKKVDSLKQLQNKLPKKYKHR